MHHKNKLIPYSSFEKASKASKSLVNSFGGRLFTRAVNRQKNFYEIQYCSSNDAARKEVMMSKLYNLADVYVPDAQLVDLGGGIYAVAKKLSDGEKKLYLPGNMITK